MPFRISLSTVLNLRNSGIDDAFACSLTLSSFETSNAACTLDRYKTWNGEPMYPDTLTKWFNQFLKRHNLRHVALHSVRHSNATLLIAEGTDIRTVSNRLGHAQTSTTLNIYTHALTSKDKQAADTLDDVLAIG